MMMLLKRNLILLLILTILTACQEPCIEGTPKYYGDARVGKMYYEIQTDNETEILAFYETFSMGRPWTGMSEFGKQSYAMERNEYGQQDFVRITQHKAWCGDKE